MTAQVTGTKVNIPFVLTLAVIPDMDILIPFVGHRGPFHSVIMAVIIFIPIFALYHKNAFPYFVALAQHSLVGDFIAGGDVQLLWPITTQFYGVAIDIRNPINIMFEWLAFLVASILMAKKDVKVLLQPNSSNLILIIPTLTVLLPTFLAFPFKVPIALVPLHILCLILFSMSILIGTRKAQKISFKRKNI